MLSEPSLFYRATGQLNRMIWRMPLPRRALARLSAIAYRNPPMPAQAVRSVLDALEEAGVASWLAGGWGVEALAGAQNRVHRDLDLVIDERDLSAATAALATLGYSEWYRIESDRPLHRRVVLHDHDLAGRAVDLHPIELSAVRLKSAVGELDGRPARCLAPDLQLGARKGYRARREDRVDLAVLRRVLTRPATALVVPVPGARGLIDDSAREAGMPPHITLIYPFLEARKIDARVLARLGEVFSGVPAFDFALARVDSFPGVQYLAPEPAEPFVELAGRLVERWPEHPPYRGAHGELIPHLTVAYGEEPPPDLATALPLDVRAHEVWLMARTPGSWVPKRRFALGRR